jgi:hypothetical protein
MTAQPTRHRVFLSVGRQSDPRHKDFVDGLRDLVTTSGLEIAALPPGFYENPLDRVFSEMQGSNGALVVCFERIYGANAQEFRTGPQPKPIKPLTTTTVWNHVEAAIARRMDLPTLIVAEKGCRVEGMLEPSVEFRVCWIDFTREELGSPRFKGIFAGWRDAVLANRPATGKRKDVDSDSIDLLVEASTFDILRKLRWRHWAIIVVWSVGAFALGGYLAPLLNLLSK